MMHTIPKSTAWNILHLIEKLERGEHDDELDSLVKTVGKDIRATIKRRRRGGRAWQETYGPEWTYAFRESIRQRDNRRCAICGECGRVVHHINYNPKDNDPANLIIVCKECHFRGIHNPRTSWEYWQDRLTKIQAERGHVRASEEPTPALAPVPAPELDEPEPENEIVWALRLLNNEELLSEHPDWWKFVRPDTDGYYWVSKKFARRKTGKNHLRIGRTPRTSQTARPLAKWLIQKAKEIEAERGNAAAGADIIGAEGDDA